MPQMPTDTTRTPSPQGGPTGSWLGESAEDFQGGEKSLRRILVEEGAMGWRDVVQLGIDVATQLDAFHRRGVCPHGGVCPESIVRTASGAAYVLGLPVVGAPLGYRAPETFRRPGGRDADARADVFSLGVVLFEALAGNRVYPFRVVEAPSPAVGNALPSYLPEHDLGSLAPGIPTELRRVVERATRLAPENRFESALALADALRAAAEEGGLARAPQVSRGQSSRHRSTQRLLFTLGAVVVLMTLALAVFLWRQPAPVSTSSEAERIRGEALEVSAPTLVPELWAAAEGYRPQGDDATKTELYRRARDAAWQKRLQQVTAAGEQASAFDASGEAAFARANDARARAEHLWSAQRVTDAWKSLADAEAFYLAAVAHRRERWVEGIRAQLRQESERGQQRLRPEDEAKLRTLVEEAKALIDKAEPSMADLRRAEAKVTELRHEIASALERSGEWMAARQRGSEAVQRAEASYRSAARAAQAFPRLLGAFTRGKELLDAARQAVERDPSQAVTLAEEAAQRFRQVESQAERELAELRQLAWSARRRARELDSEEDATEAYDRAEALWRKAEAKEQDWVARRDAYQQAKVAFDKTLEEARQARLAAPAVPVSQATAVAPQPAATAVRPLQPAIDIQAPTPALAAMPSPVAPRPHPAGPARSGSLHDQQGPMPADLAAGIQTWLRETCANLDRSLARRGEGRARCEELVVHDRRDRSQVRITYSLVQGAMVPEGIRWAVPNRRSATLDCSRVGCQCVAGDDC